MKNKFIVLVISIVIFIIVVSLSISRVDEISQKKEQVQIEELVLEYLKDKYNEEFTITSFSKEKNIYNVQEDDDYIEYTMNSYIYNLEVKSKRLISFDCLYVTYIDDEYEELEEYNIMEPGIYDNYLYNYMLKSIKSDIKSTLYEIITSSKELSLSLTDITLNLNNMFVPYSEADEEIVTLYNNYNSLDNDISPNEYYSTLNEISSVSLILDFSIDDYITEGNLDEFKSELLTLINYLQEKGYSNYDINISFKNYVSARATRYLDNDKEQVYLIFDYENYSDIDEDDKLGIYVLDVE